MTRPVRFGPGEHRPESEGRDRQGYGRCLADGELWPCRAHRETWYPLNRPAGAPTGASLRRAAGAGILEAIMEESGWTVQTDHTGEFPVLTCQRVAPAGHVTVLVLRVESAA